MAKKTSGVELKAIFPHLIYKSVNQTDYIYRTTCSGYSVKNRPKICLVYRRKKYK